MKSLVLLLATVALASATFYGGKYIDIKEDGTIFIKSEDGKQIYISKNYGPYGQKLEVEVTGPNYPTKTYQFDFNSRVSTSYKNYQGQYDILDVIFREYLGHVDEYAYQQLLNKVHKAVLEGFFDSRVLYVLQALIEDTKWNNLVSGYDFYGQFGGLLNTKTYQGKYELGSLFRGQGVQDQYYTKYDTYHFYNVLMKIFDKQVLQTVFAQQQMYNQEMYGQYSYEKMWDMIFTHEGIFDHQFIVEILNNEELRNYFVQHGFFDVNVLNQLRVAYKTEGVYDQYLLQRLFNTQVLKNFFINHKISVYDILGHTSYNQYYDSISYNNGYYGYNMLKKIVSQPAWRQVLVQSGIFNKNILDQILYRYNTQGIFDDVLLRQLVNKQVLYRILAQYGVVDQTILNQYVDNEYLGLNFLYKNNYFQTTRKMGYNHVFGVYGNIPEYSKNMQMYGGNFWKNMLYGQSYYGYNKGPYNFGKYYQQFPLAQQVY